MVPESPRWRQGRPQPSGGWSIRRYCAPCPSSKAISAAIFDLDGTIAARDEILSFFNRRLVPPV
jgi:hypothetical protein